MLAHIQQPTLPFDSVICGNDRIAFMVYQTLLAQGLRIPQDVAVVGYDNMVGIGDLFFRRSQRYSSRIMILGA